MPVDTAKGGDAHDEVVEGHGYRIVLSHLTPADGKRESLFMRMLAAISWWGVQEDQWQWSVLEGDKLLASDYELSRLAALEGARYWARTHGLEVPGDEQAV